ncbi:MAG: flavodoxin-dependent (E)-4-hydroxy-3-methylbut-2-enyl-diphosphate synthase [Candidatus Omnitrophica bacterium]|nr:flavodoxin-dependent (E)-4-hydroxy-3-methylbut-2-enyl-diphosphate synthase [Candidatus Omnitrophota bacterium]MDD5430251.1 flavodoxin-dependent (E)-4-hydroxy-3-methylbut-2-enyl-diphosphate synthase [Candidatus Omnitrophota bacterium]
MNRVVNIGRLKVGGSNPVRIKAMLKTPIEDTKRLIREAKRLEKEGAEALRVAVKQRADAGIVRILSQHISVPLVADIHFDYRIALEAIKEGFPGIRLNPLNISRKKEVKEIIRAAKDNGVSIRVGVNSGGFRKNFSSPCVMAKAMVREAKKYIRYLEREKFFDTMVSFKGSDINTTIQANRIFSAKETYPLHLGITATGPFLEAVVKSAIGQGILLKEGIGSVMRVSLTAPSFWEVRVAKSILQSLDLRRFGPEIISCPTCSRCEVDLIKIVSRFKRELEKTKLNKPLRIAIMGCVVNGPGEACQADIGAAFGKSKAVIFRKDKIIRRSTESRVIGDLLEEIKRLNQLTG